MKVEDRKGILLLPGAALFDHRGAISAVEYEWFLSQGGVAEDNSLLE
jgi:hypothetical protein